MANDVLIDGWVGADPDDYPATEDKKRFVKFDICQQPKKAKQPTWLTINAYGPIADKIVDGLEIGKGDQVRIKGFLVSRFANPGCGRRHRFTFIVARRLAKGCPVVSSGGDQSPAVGVPPL